MNPNHELFFKSIKYFGFTIALMFSAPFALYQAFKNQNHPLYLPVLVLGLIMALAAIALGFYSVKLLVDYIFYKKKKL